MRRRGIERLPGYDYSGDGAYFVTLTLQPRWPSLGRIVAGRFTPSAEGEIVEDVWRSLSAVSKRVRLDEYCVMPDHLHGIIFIESHHPQCTRHAIHELRDVDQKQQSRRRMLLPLLIGRFKQQSAKRINQLRTSPGRSVWQRNYYEHIIRSDDSLERIRWYIRNNPAASMTKQP